MSMSNDNHAELLDLTAAEVDGSITPDQHTRLAAILRETPDARAAYLSYRRLHAALQWRAGEAGDQGTGDRRQGTGSSEPTCSLSPRERAGVRANFRLAPSLLAIAAALLLSAAAVAIYIFAASRPLSPVPSDSAPIVTLIDVSSGGAVLVEGSLANAGQQYAAGAITIDAGFAEFQLRSGASVRLRGRTHLDVIDRMNASLDAGVATFRCPPRAVGFTVHLPGGARVVDLGTAFTVWVDDAGRSRVYLHEGSVELHAADGSKQTLAGHLAYTADAEGRSIAPIDPADAPGLVTFDPAWIDPAGSAYAAAVLADEPLAYWRFDRAHEGYVLDQTGNRYDASIAGEHRLDAGRLDQAFLLAGKGDAECDAVRGLMVTDAYTVECWARPDSTKQSAVVSLGDSILIEFIPAGGRGKSEPSIRYLHRAVGDSGGLALYHTYRPERWYHIVAVKTPDAMTLYIDGEPVATGEITDPLTRIAPAFAIGRLSTKPLGTHYDRAMHGAIDEVAIYTRALSPEQVRAHFRAGALPQDDQVENPDLKETP